MEENKVDNNNTNNKIKQYHCMAWHGIHFPFDAWTFFEQKDVPEQKQNPIILCISYFHWPSNQVAFYLDSDFEMRAHVQFGRFEKGCNFILWNTIHKENVHDAFKSKGRN